MKKGTTSSAAGGKKNAVIPIASKADRPTASTSTKRKEGVVAVEAATTSTTTAATAVTSTLPAKKTKYNEATSTSTSTTTTTATTNGSSTSFSTSTSTATATTSPILPKSNGVEIQFTFGTLPTIPSVTTSTSSSSSSSPSTTSKDSSYRATVLICHRKTLQQMVQNGGNQLLNSMLHISMSDRTLQAMYTDCCASGGSSSSSTTIVSSYIEYDVAVDVDVDVDHEPERPHHKLYIIALPDTVSRNNHIWSVHSITDCIKQSCNPRKNAYHCRFVFCGPNISSMIGSLSCSVARAFSVYSRKSSSSSSSSPSSSLSSTSASPSTPIQQQPTQKVHISFMDVSENGIVEYLPSSSSSSLSSSSSSIVVESGKDQQHQYNHFKDLCSSIQYAAQLVDMTPEELTTTFYAEECRRIVSLLQTETKQHVVTYKEIVGTELDTLGYGGLYGIGKAATCPPYLVLIEYIPTATHLDTSSSSSSSSLLPYDESIALVGKGIVYDTGGLSLKSKDGMPGMKYDMGGSAGLFGAFITAVQMKLRKRLLLILCLAENAIGPTAVRNDDILTLYSGKTVEVNNTDAEGRLVLADGVAHASKHFTDCNVIIDMATLTGAQLVATGKTHAGILANTMELEQRIVHAGLRSGDLVTPMLYAPELLLKEFDSKIADMKNSVKDRSNAQASCAGHFIESHLCPTYTGGWIHIDMAGPADKDGRGTAYGVALILAFLNAPGF